MSPAGADVGTSTRSTDKGKETMAPSIAIVGAGFTGTLLAVHILCNTTAPVSVHLIDQRGTFGQGVAYSTESASHLLNVRAANMSAFPDEPQHFVEWLRQRDDHAAPARSIPASGHAFVPRRLYGTYLADQLAIAERAAAPSVSCHKLRGEVIDLAREASRFALRLANGVCVRADRVALCLGHFPPRLPCSDQPVDLPRSLVISDPWERDALARVPTTASALIVGTGLTMVDVVLSLLDRGHKGPIIALSRRGLLPTRHSENRRYHDFLADRSLPERALEAFRLVRAEVQAAADQGYNWRGVIDALRSHTHRLWQALSQDEQRRFLRHIRPYWEVHRHRMAPGVAGRIAAVLDDGQLEIRAGRLRTIQVKNGRLFVAYAPRGSESVTTIAPHFLINCGGPECDFGRISHPLARSLLGRGVVRPDPLGLGIETTLDGETVGANGTPVTGLVALGPIARGVFWEMTAVPELRSMCATVGKRLSSFPVLTAQGW